MGNGMSPGLARQLMEHVVDHAGNPATYVELVAGDDGPALRWRCPVCLVRYPLPSYVCRGGWPHYDPQRPGWIEDEHAPTAVETFR